MPTSKLKDSDAFTTADRTNVQSYDFTIIWSHAIAALVILGVNYGTTSTPVGSSVDFPSLSIPL
jgi:hypothetical protein